MARESSKLTRMPFPSTIRDVSQRSHFFAQVLEVVHHVLKEGLRGGERGEGCCESSAGEVASCRIRNEFISPFAGQSQGRNCNCDGAESLQTPADCAEDPRFVEEPADEEPRIIVK